MVDRWAFLVASYEVEQLEPCDGVSEEEWRSLQRRLNDVGQLAPRPVLTLAQRRELLREIAMLSEMLCENVGRARFHEDLGLDLGGADLVERYDDLLTDLGGRAIDALRSLPMPETSPPAKRGRPHNRLLKEVVRAIARDIRTEGESLERLATRLHTILRCAHSQGVDLLAPPAESTLAGYLNKLYEK